jgi:hypothetical protein
MNREQAVKYLSFSGFSDEQIKAIEGAFTCEDAISRQAVLKIIDGWYDNNRDTENIEDLIVLITYMGSVNPQKPICPSAGVDCEDCPAYEDAIGRKAVLNTLENMDRALDEDRTVESYKDLLRECYKVLPSVTPKPKSECEHDHEILKAYSDGASAVLESIKYLIEQYEHYLELLDADMKDGSATIVTKTKYAVYTEVVKKLKEVLESEDKE